MDGNEIKLEPPELLDTVKLESLEEYEEEVKLESCDHDESAKPIQAKSKRLTFRKCAVCFMTECREYFNITKSKYRKIIVLLGAVLNGKISISSAKSSLDTLKLTACSDHFSEAIIEIFKVLEIRHIDEMHLKDNQQKLMDTVNSFSSDISFPELHKALDYYFRKDGSLQELSQLVNKEPEKLINKRFEKPKPKRRETRVCSICSLREYQHNFISTRSKFRQLILMIGCVFSELKTIEEAQVVMTKDRIYTCESHSSEAVNEIFRVLNIKKVEELQLCSIANIEILMKTVNSLDSELSFSDFQSQLYSLFARNLQIVESRRGALAS